MPYLLHHRRRHECESLLSVIYMCMYVYVYVCQVIPLCLAGQQPALDTSGELISENDEYQSARVIIDHLKAHVKDLDGDLSRSDWADLTAFRTLIQTVLEPASLCTMWLETESYSIYTQVIGSKNCHWCVPADLPWFMPSSAVSSCCCKLKQVI